MGCDFYISTYLKLHTSKGNFETLIERHRGWFDSMGDFANKKQMDSCHREFTIYENSKYIVNSFHDYNQEYGESVACFMRQINKKRIDAEHEKNVENDEIRNNKTNVEDLQINFEDVLKITIYTKTSERT